MALIWWDAPMKIAGKGTEGPIAARYDHKGSSLRVHLFGS